MRPEFSIKERSRLAGLTAKDIADRLRVPYGTLTGWLNGFSPLPEDRRREIEYMIGAAEAARRA